jgi:hypothetical protein
MPFASYFLRPFIERTSPKWTDNVKDQIGVTLTAIREKGSSCESSNTQGFPE